VEKTDLSKPASERWFSGISLTIYANHLHFTPDRHFLHDECASRYIINSVTVLNWENFYMWLGSYSYTSFCYANVCVC